MRSWLLLSHEKQAADKKANIDSLCETDLCQLIAFDQKIKDVGKKEKFLPSKT